MPTGAIGKQSRISNLKGFMSESALDPQQFVFLDHESLGLPTVHARSLQLFRDVVVLPSLRALDREIEESVRNGEPGSVFYESHLVDLFQTTVESYVLAVQSIWERGLRSLLILRERRLNGGRDVDKLQNAGWSTEHTAPTMFTKSTRADSLQSHFQRLLAVPMTAFDSYGDLDLLQHLGNAIRHGDGRSAKRVHDLAPTLWFGWLAPGFVVQAGPHNVTVPHDAPKYPSFDNVTVQKIVLEQMIQSVTHFWEDLECMRCNSFRRKDEVVVRHLESFLEERRSRYIKRLWTADRL